MVGLGETFFGPAEVAAYLHETAGPRLLGRDALAIDALRVALKGYVGTRGTGVECRGNSAVDLALWDILGKVMQRPVYQLLGVDWSPSARCAVPWAGGWAAGVHLSLNAPNTLIQEVVRAFFTGWVHRAGHWAAGGR